MVTDIHEYAFTQTIYYRLWSPVWRFQSVAHCVKTIQEFAKPRHSVRACETR